MKIDISKWKNFELADIFEKIERGKEILSQCNSGSFPVVGSSNSNNGVVMFGKGEHLFEANSITIANNGSVGSTFYQTNDFYATSDVTVLRSSKLNNFSALFLVSVLSQESYKFSYGRKWAVQKMKKHTICLPAVEKEYCKTFLPDYNYMERYIKALKYKKLTSLIRTQCKKLDILSWSEFTMCNIFDIKKGKRLTKMDMEEGDINYIGAISENNGVRQKINVELSKLQAGNCITVNYNGSVGEAFYQKEPFWASDDVNILYAKDWKMNKYIAMFLITVIRSNKYRFGYGRKWTLEKMSKSILKLPVKSDGSPNFLYMEKYIKSLPYSDKI